MEKLRTVLLLTLEYVSRDMCRGSTLYWSGVLVGVFFVNSSAKLNIPQPGGHIEPVTNSSIFQVRPVEQMWRICGFTLTPSSARPLGMEELRQGLITCVIHRVWFRLFTQFYFAVDVHVVPWSFGNAFVGEFLVSFLFVFTVFRTAVNTDSFTRRR